MPIYSNKIGGLSGEITNPTEIGQKGYNSRGQRVYWTGSSWSTQDPTRGQTEVTRYMDMESTQQKLADAEKWAEGMGIDPSEYGSDSNLLSYYRRYQSTQEQKPILTVDGKPAWGSDEQYWRSQAHNYGLSPDQWELAKARGETHRDFDPANNWTPKGVSSTNPMPWYSPGGPLTTEPPETNEENPVIRGRDMPDVKMRPTDTSGGETKRGREGGDLGGGGGMFEYNPPDGVPLNPIRQENSEFFRPYGKPVSRMSDTLTFGGLPRSTGPWGEMGGYYGGFPENYSEMPEGYHPPNTGGGAGDPTSPPGVIGEQIPFTPLPVNPYPARPDLEDWYAENGEPGGTGGTGGTGGGTGGGGGATGGEKNPYQRLHIDPVTGLPMDAMQIAQQMAQAGQLRTG